MNKILSKIRSYLKFNFADSTFIMSDYRYTSSPSSMIANLHLQSLEARLKTAKLSMFYKAVI